MKQEYLEAMKKKREEVPYVPSKMQNSTYTIVEVTGEGNIYMHLFKNDKITLRRYNKSIKWIASGEKNWVSGEQEWEGKFLQIFILFESQAVWKDHLLM